MNESIRVSGKTVNDAVMNAAIALSTTSDNIEYTVIEKESKGFLGIGSRDAVIEAKVKEKAQQEDTVSGDKTAETASDPAETEAETETEPAGKTGTAASVTAEASTAASTAASTVGAASAGAASSEASAPASSAPASSARAASAPASSGAGSENEDSYEKRREHRNSDIKVLDDPSEAIERAETFLKDVFSSMDMDVKISSNYDGECLNVSMEGDEMGLLIGKRGQTLDSLQYLTSLVVNKGKPYYVRVKLDTEDYRERRKATLENLAKNIAIKVKKTRQPVYLEPMNPYERRIIHSALQNDPFVTTHSEGEEPDRKVVVTLKKDADLELLERKYGDRNRRYGRGGGRGYSRVRGSSRGGYGRGGHSSYQKDDRDDRNSDRQPSAKEEAPADKGAGEE